MSHTIRISDNSYRKLKQFGGCGDSFESAIANLLKEREERIRNE